MVGTTISFAKEKNGYDRAQVDSYITKISEAYQTTYNEFLDISNKYMSLLEESENTKKQEQTELSPDVIAKTLLNTEMLAQKIIVDAKTEATATISEANEIINSAKAEEAEARATARKIINDAKDEADAMVERVRKNLEQALKMINQASGEAELALHAKETGISDVA